jgi:hypothetical protein
MALPRGIPALSEADFDQIESELDSARPSAEQRARVQEHLELLREEDD